MRTAVQQELVRRFRNLRDGRTTDLGTSPLVLSPSEYTSVEQLAHEREHKRRDRKSTRLNSSH